VAVNDGLPDALETLSNYPYGEGWIVKIGVNDEPLPAHLMDYTAYQLQCREDV
jgi:glycine cleavage system H lipoate-binding protein